MSDRVMIFDTNDNQVYFAKDVMLGYYDWGSVFLWNMDYRNILSLDVNNNKIKILQPELFLKVLITEEGRNVSSQVDILSTGWPRILQEIANNEDTILDVIYVIKNDELIVLNYKHGKKYYYVNGDETHRLTNASFLNMTKELIEFQPIKHEE